MSIYVCGGMYLLAYVVGGMARWYRPCGDIEREKRHRALLLNRGRSLSRSLPAIGSADAFKNAAGPKYMRHIMARGSASKW